MSVTYSDAYNAMQADPGRQELWLLEIAAKRLTDDTDVTLYFSSAQYGTGPYDTPAHRAYKACITRGFEFSASAESLSGPAYGLLPSRQAGSIVLGQVLGELDLGDINQLGGVPLRDFAFAGRAAVVKHGGYSPALGRKLDYDEFATVFTGVVDGQPLISTDTVTIKLRSKDALMQYPINTRTYFGCKGAVLFPSGTGEVSLSNGSVFNFTSSDFSWEFLFYANANASATNRPIISRGVSGTRGYKVEHMTTGAIAFSTYGGGAGTQTTISDPITVQVWCRISIVRDGASVRIYRDGVDITATAATHVDPVTSTDIMYFSRNNGATEFLELAMISDIRCWSIALESDPINSRMHRPLDSSEYAATGLVGYWPSNEVAGSTIDQKVVATGATYDGTLASGAVLVPSLLGGDEMQGDPLPHAWGYFDGFGPVLVDEATQIYQVHSGSVEAIDRVDLGGGEATDMGTGYTTVIAFLAATTADGEHDTCITSGGTYIRFGNLPVHPVTVAGRGDNAGGTFRYTCADLVRFIVCNMGQYPLTDPTDLDTASFTALNTANSAQLGYVYAEEHSVADVVNFFLESVGAVGFFRRATDLFAVQQFTAVADAATPTRTITERDIDADSFETIEVNTPTFRVNARYKHNRTVLSTDAMQEGVVGTDREKFFRKEWRIAGTKSSTVKVNFPDSTVFLYNTAFYRWFEAYTECERQLALLSTRSQGFRFLVKQGKYDFDRLDTVYFDFGDFDENGVRQNRFGSGPTRVFTVLDVADDVETSGALLTIWRDDA